jgi:hypothetical protein
MRIGTPELNMKNQWEIPAAGDRADSDRTRERESQAARPSFFADLQRRLCYPSSIMN